MMADLHYAGSAEEEWRLRAALEEGRARGAERVVALGDLVCAECSREALRRLEEVRGIFSASGMDSLLLPGNHDLDWLSKADFYAATGRDESEVRGGFRFSGTEFVVVDANFSPGGRAYERGNFVWEEAELPAKELRRLEGRLREASAPVAVLSHQNLDAPRLHAVRNATETFDVLKRSGKVCALFQGHRHLASEEVRAGIRCVTLGAFRDGAEAEIVEFPMPALPGEPE